MLAGLAAALVTVLARRANESGLAGAAAILSLLIALLLTIFIVPPLARSARVEVANLDFPFEPTSGGGVFLVIIIVVGFAAWNTGNNLLFLVFSLLVSTLFVGWVAARASLRDLTVSARFPDHIFAAEAGAGDRDAAQHQTYVAFVFRSSSRRVVHTLRRPKSETPPALCKTSARLLQLRAAQVPRRNKESSSCFRLVGTF